MLKGGGAGKGQGARDDTSVENVLVWLEKQVQKKRRAGKFRGEGNWSCGL